MCPFSKNLFCFVFLIHPFFSSFFGVFLAFFFSKSSFFFVFVILGFLWKNYNFKKNKKKSIRLDIFYAQIFLGSLCILQGWVQVLIKMVIFKVFLYIYIYWIMLCEVIFMAIFRIFIHIYICLPHHCLKTCPGLGIFSQINFHNCQSNIDSIRIEGVPLYHIF